MKVSVIKANWASISIIENDAVLLCVRNNSNTLCVQFKSLERLKEAINKRKVLIKKWAVSIPRNLCILKPLSLPASDLSEALTMIEFELPSIVPLPVNEIVYSVSLLGRQENMLSVLVCIIKLNTLEEYLKLYLAAEIKPERIIMDSFAIQNWITTTFDIKSEPLISAFINKQDCIIQTSIDRNFQRDNKLIFSEGDCQANAEEILSEILHQREDLPDSLKQQVSFIVIGIKKDISPLTNLLSSTIRDSSLIKTVTILPELEVLEYNEKNNFVRKEKNISDKIITSVGLLDLASHSKLPDLNLLPQQYAKKSKKTARLKQHILTGSLVLILILLVWISLLASNWRIKRLSRIIESQIVPIEDVARTVETKRQRVQAIQRQLSCRGQITSVLKDIYSITPDTISISKLQYTSNYSGTYIDIEGQADTIETAYMYNGKDKATLLSQLQSTYAQQIHQAGGSIVVFSAHSDIQDN